MPIGSPLGGYSARIYGLGAAVEADDRPRRFTTGMAPSVGQHDAPFVEALALEAGGEVFVLVRVDAPYVTENVLFDLERAAAPDGSLRGRIMLTASHSHAGYGGWQPSLILMLGTDRPRREIIDRVQQSMAKTIRDALAARQPAKIGFAIEPRFDPKDTVSRDRRMENNALVGGNGKDPIAWAMRVDRADGTPLAAVVDFPIHGTVGTEKNPLASTDAPGAVAHALSSELGYPVLHVQGPAGDVSPADPRGRTLCPDGQHCLDMPMLEIIGARAAALAGPLVKGITTSATAQIEVVTRTFYIGRSVKVQRPDGRFLEYAPADEEYEPDGVIFDKDGKIVSPIDEFNVVGGAGLCGDPYKGSFATIPGAKGMGVYSSCVDVLRGRGLMFSFFDVSATMPVPLCDTTRATATAVKINDYLLVGAPGEATGPWAAELRARSPAGEKTLLLGYTDEHMGYLLTPEDWMLGGYEPSTNMWGPLEGAVVLDNILDAAKIAWTPEREDPEAGTSRFNAFEYPPTPAIETLATTDHGKPASGETMWWPDVVTAKVTIGPLARAVSVARFAWYGGDPIVDAPVVTIERETMTGFVRYSSSVVITYVPEPLKSTSPSHHIYGATWQLLPPAPYALSKPLEPYSLPLGRYRFHVTGAAKGAAYALDSEPFEVTAAPLAMGSTVTLGPTTTIHATLGNAPGLRALREEISDADISLPGPWTVKVTFTDDTTKDFTVMPTKGTGTLTVSGVPRSVEVRDPSGNGGVLP